MTWSAGSLHCGSYNRRREEAKLSPSRAQNDQIQRHGLGSTDWDGGVGPGLGPAAQACANYTLPSLICPPSRNVIRHHVFHCCVLPYSDSPQSRYVISHRVFNPYQHIRALASGGRIVGQKMGFPFRGFQSRRPRNLARSKATLLLSVVEKRPQYTGFPFGLPQLRSWHIIDIHRSTPMSTTSPTPGLPKLSTVHIQSRKESIPWQPTVTQSLLTVSKPHRHQAKQVFYPWRDAIQTPLFDSIYAIIRIQTAKFHRYKADITPTRIAPSRFDCTVVAFDESLSFTSPCQNSRRLPMTSFFAV